MEHKIIPLSIEKNYKTIIDIFSFVPPFSKMRKREKDVFAKLLEYNDKYKALEDRDKSKLIFDTDVYEEISKSLDCNLPVVTNVMTELRTKNIIIKNTQGYEIINPKVILPKPDILSFKFKK